MDQKTPTFQIGELVGIKRPDKVLVLFVCVYKELPNHKDKSASEFIPYKNLDSKNVYMVTEIETISYPTQSICYVRLFGDDFNFWISAKCVEKF